MGSLFRILMGRPLLRPLIRIAVGLIAIPVFRLILRRFVRLQDLDDELEKDLEQWFRAALVLLVATANMEESLFGWLRPILGSPAAESREDTENAMSNPQFGGTLAATDNEPDTIDEAGEVAALPEDIADESRRNWWWIVMGFRIMVAIGAVQTMPDQELFAVIHPGPPKLKYDRNRSFLAQFREQFRPVCKGFLCKHMNQSSPVFAILAAIAPGRVGWFCYFVAVTQYLIIGLVTSRDRALDVLSVFDRQVAIRRRELIEEFDLGKKAETSAPSSDAEPAVR